MSKRYDDKRRLLQVGEYQRKNGTYEYKYSDKFGRRHSIYATTLKELRDKKKDILRDNIDRINIDKNKVTLNDFFYLWVKIKRGIKDNTMKNYIYMYQRFVENKIGTLKLAEIKKTDIKFFYINLLENENLKVATIDNIQSVIHQILEMAVEDDFLRYNPADRALKDIKRINVNIEKTNCFTFEEQRVFENFLNYSNEFERWRPIFKIMLLTGMRVGEITALQWEDIDMKSKSISINKTLVYYSKGVGLGNIYAINTPKTISSKRLIPVSDEIIGEFLLQNKINEKFKLICKSNINGYDNFIFLNRFGEVLNSSVLNKALKRIIKKINFEQQKNESDILLPHISNHSLRHCFATRMCEAGVNMKVIQEILGHSSFDITMNVYTKVTKDFKEKEMANFDKIIHDYK